MSTNDIVGAIWLIAVLFAVLPIGAVFAFSPETIVRLQAKFYYKSYKTALKRSDEEVDEPYRLPWDKALMGKRSEFMVRGIEEPEAYRGLLKYYRIFGVTILIMFGCVFSIVIMLILSTLFRQWYG